MLQGSRVKSRHFKLIFVITQLCLQPFFFSEKKPTQLQEHPPFPFLRTFITQSCVFFSLPSKFLFTQNSPTEGNFNFLKDFSVLPLFVFWRHFFSSYFFSHLLEVASFLFFLSFFFFEKKDRGGVRSNRWKRFLRITHTYTGKAFS